MSWENPTDKAMGPKLLKEMEEHMINIRKNLKVSQDRKKSYADKDEAHREFRVGEHVFLKV